MKTKEELLKIYSAYLPYELKGKYHLPHWQYQEGLENKEYPLQLESFENFIKGSYVPILYSMDMLTKEIEHKGERFIPIEKLFDIETNLEWSKSGHIKAEKGKDEYWVRQKEEGRSFHFGYNAEKNYFYKIDSENCKQSVWKQLEMFQKLFEWHFNVFGLQESEYIQKQSVIQK